MNRIPRSILLGAVLWAGLACACRYEVQLEGDSGHAPDVALDAPAPDDVPPLDDAPDAPEVPDAPLLRACEGPGVDLGPARVLDGPGLGLARSRDGTRYALLVPAAARPEGTAAHLMVLDATGVLLAELDLEGLPLGASVWASESGWLVVGAAEALAFDAGGAPTGEPIALPAPPSETWPGAIGWIDAGRLVYVGTTNRLVEIEPALGEARETTIDVSGQERVLVHPGGVTMSRPPPENETVELAPDLSGSIALTVAWPSRPLGRLLLGVEHVGEERRWLAADGEEFRNNIKLYQLAEDGAPGAILADATILAPLSAALVDGLVTVSAGDATMHVIDLRAATFTLISGSSRGAAVRDGVGEGLAVVSIVPHATTPSLLFRCGIL